MSIGKSASLIQKLVTGTILAQRKIKDDPNHAKEILLHWTGSNGEVHEIWYPLSQIKIED